MKRIRVLFIAILATIVLNGPATPGAGSIAVSYVYHNTAITPNQCFVRGRSQQFCFQAISHTTDNDYVYYLWMHFPDDWLVSNVTVFGEPYCTSGGTFGPFSWYGFPDNEVQITHVRYQAVNDACSAYYCVQVTPGSPSPSLPLASVSWYWKSSEYGSPPFYPCSSDGYTPNGQPACDEMTTPPAYIDRCEFNVYIPGMVKNQR